MAVKIQINASNKKNNNYMQDCASWFTMVHDGSRSRWNRPVFHTTTEFDESKPKKEN